MCMHPDVCSLQAHMGSKKTKRHTPDIITSENVYSAIESIDSIFEKTLCAHLDSQNRVAMLCPSAWIWSRESYLESWLKKHIENGLLKQNNMSLITSFGCRPCSAYLPRFAWNPTWNRPSVILGLYRIFLEGASSTLDVHVVVAVTHTCSLPGDNRNYVVVRELTRVIERWY